MKTVKTKGIRGVTDLYPLHPYDSNGEWFQPSIEITEEEYLKDPEAYKKAITHFNNKYIQYLKENGEYEKEYEIEIEIKENPYFDLKSNNDLESYRIIFLDRDNEDAI